jgi:hypothetical protein
MFLLYLRENNYIINKTLIKALEFPKLFVYKPLGVLRRSFIAYKQYI